MAAPCPRPLVPKLHSKLKAMKRFMVSKPDKHSPFPNVLWFERNVRVLAGKTDEKNMAAASQMLPIKEI